MPNSSFDEHLRRRVRVQGVLASEVYPAFALIAATLVALVWANIGDSYTQFWSTEVGVTLGDRSFQLTAREWVGDGLITLFFFMVGLDVRRELAMGALRRRERAVLPVAAAFGGVLVPAALFLLLTVGEEYAGAWGAVISTDTAFAVGVLAIIGPRRAPRLRIFILALAVIDDLTALLVIAVVYSDDVELAPLMLAVLVLAVVLVLRRLRVWRVTPYVVLGLLLWACVFASGVHPTISGVLLALLMPVHATSRHDIETASKVFHFFRQAPVPQVAKNVQTSVARAIPMNQKLSAELPPYVNYVVVPLFAVANAGVSLSIEALTQAFTSGLTWAIVVGLAVGKTIGISVVALAVMRVVPSSRLPGLDAPRVAGLASLCGVGFTVSLLVVDLSLTDPQLEEFGRVGVLTASLLALIASTVIFKVGERLRPLPPPQGASLEREVDPGSDHVRGPGGAAVTLVVYAAMEDVYRYATSGALREVREWFPDDVRVVYRHHVVESDTTLTAALALEAGGMQGRFWEMHDEMTRPGDLDRERLDVLAERVGLDLAEFDQEVDHADDLGHVLDDCMDLGEEDDRPEPVVYLNGHRLEVPLNAWRIGQAVHLELTAGRV